MNSRSIEQTYYEVLEITPAAPHHEIVQAYQRAKEAYSPDSPALYTMFTKEEAEDLRRLVEEAFLVLGNQNKRKEYDQVLLARKSNKLGADLPDFPEIKKSSQPTPTATPTAAKAPAPATAPAVAATNSSTVPTGFAKSRLSVYEIKPEIESEIASQTMYDGAFLRKIRQYKNINLEQLSKETRISRSYLAAVESDDFSALPAPVFLRGFILQMAKHLGLDENKVATSYMSRIKKEE